MDWHEVYHSVERSRKLLEALWNQDGETVARGIESVHDEISILKYHEIIKTLISTHTTISTMESCTSGLIASMITDTEGASAIFPGGYVTYLNETKVHVGVDAGIIEKYGVYSAECAEAMARTVAKNLGTDIAIGITGTTGNVDPNNAGQRTGTGVFLYSYKWKGAFL